MSWEKRSSLCDFLQRRALISESLLRQSLVCLVSWEGLWVWPDWVMWKSPKKRTKNATTEFQMYSNDVPRITQEIFYSFCVKWMTCRKNSYFSFLDDDPENWAPSRVFSVLTIPLKYWNTWVWHRITKNHRNDRCRWCRFTALCSHLLNTNQTE